MDDDDDMGFDFDVDSSEESQKNDSFDNFEPAPPQQFDKNDLIEKYEKLREESLKIDEIAREIRSTIQICRQMEMCYSKRVASGPKTILKARYLHDSSVVLMLNVENPTDVAMKNWKLTVRSLPVFRDCHKAQSSETLNLDTIQPGTSKSYNLKMSEIELPLIFNFTLTRHINFENIEKIFHINLDPIAFTNWDLCQQTSQQQQVDATRDAFQFALRLPHSLIDLVAGSPDTISIDHVFRAFFHGSQNNISSSSKSEQQCFVLNDETIRVEVAREPAAYRATIFASDSRIAEKMRNEMYVRIIVEMVKLKSRPKNKEVEVLENFGNDLQSIYENMICQF